MQHDTPTGDERENHNMPIQERGEAPRSKGPMTPNQDRDDEGGRSKGPMSPRNDD